MAPAESPDDEAWTRLVSVDPILRGLIPAATALGLTGRHILHAGPPLDAAEPIPVPILNAAVIACIYEGWADDEDMAERLVLSGAVELGAAQDHGVVTPLASVVSPSMPLQEVVDSHDPQRRAYSPLSSGAGPQLRFGARDPEIVERLRWRRETLAAAVSAALAEPIPLVPIAIEGLHGGDDLHGRATAATLALREVLAARIGDDPRFVEVLAHIDRSPLFFLTIWMAACKCMLRAAEGVPGSTMVTAMGGNGRLFGLQLAGRPQEWVTVRAASPEGPRLDPSLRATASGALGDSAVVDATGFGGQAMSLSPDVMALLGEFVPRGIGDLPDLLLLGEHPAFAEMGIRVGLDAARVAETGTPPVVTLSMIDASGRSGLIGRGTYRPPVELFVEACRRVRGG